MTEQQIIQEGEKAYQKVREKGHVKNLSEAFAFALGWQAAINMFKENNLSVSATDQS